MYWRRVAVPLVATMEPTRSVVEEPWRLVVFNAYVPDVDSQTAIAASVERLEAAGTLIALPRPN